MYDYIKGKLARKAENYAVVEANGVGYKIITTKSSLANVKDGEVICEDLCKVNINDFEA